jgi:hypothetical protein
MSNRAQRLREKRRRHERMLRLHKPRPIERLEDLEFVKMSHPRIQIALHIDPSRTGWCWVSKKVPGGRVQYPVDFCKLKYAKRLADWMGQQPWWNDKIAQDEGTCAQLYSALCDAFAECMIGEQHFCTRVSGIMLAHLAKLTALPAPAAS